MPFFWQTQTYQFDILLPWKRKNVLKSVILRSFFPQPHFYMQSEQTLKDIQCHNNSNSYKTNFTSNAYKLRDRYASLFFKYVHVMHPIISVATEFHLAPIYLAILTHLYEEIISKNSTASYLVIEKARLVCYIDGNFILCCFNCVRRIFLQLSNRLQYQWMPHLLFPI